MEYNLIVSYSRYVLFTIQSSSTQYIVQYTLNSVHSKLYSFLHCTPCSPFTVHCTLLPVHSILMTLHCTLYSALCTVCTVHCSVVYSVECVHRVLGPGGVGYISDRQGRYCEARSTVGCEICVHQCISGRL